MTVWSWVVDLLNPTPRFQVPAGEWMWPEGAGRVGETVQGVGGRYRLIGLLRAGGQARLWAALDREDGDALVVVKAVMPGAGAGTTSARLSREVRILKRLSGDRTLT